QASSIAAKEGSRDTADNGKGTEKGKQSENSADTADGGKNPGEGGSDTPAKAPRKRTKTGCLSMYPLNSEFENWLENLYHFQHVAAAGLNVEKSDQFAPTAPNRKGTVRATTNL